MRAKTALLLITIFAAPVLAQEEASRIFHDGSGGLVSTFSGRPLVDAANALAREFGVQVNVEDALYFFRDDVVDVTAQVSRVPNPARRTLVPRSVSLETRFVARSDGTPVDVPQLFQDLVEAANALLPYAYRIDHDGDVFTLVATRTRDAQGRATDLTPIFDRRVSIPLGTRRIYEHVSLLTRALEAQTGIHLPCCQSGVAGIPWGSTVVSFEARDEPARQALLRLVRSEPGRYQWSMRCQPGDMECFINIAPVPTKRR